MAIKIKVKKLGIKRTPGFLFFLQGNNVVKKKRGSQKREIVKKDVFKRTKGFLFFLDGDGDISKSPMKGR